MPPNDDAIDPEKPPVDPNNPNPDSITDAAAQILEEVRKQKEAEEKPVATAPSSQPSASAMAEQREAFKKKMGYSEEQMTLYERDRMSSQAPVILELAKMKVKEGHKDFDQLKDAFEKEIQIYQNAGRIIDPQLADSIFLMVKGRELEAGRYTPPSSQPAPKNPTPGSPSRRIAPRYNGAEPGLSSGGSGKDDAPDGEDEGTLSEKEKLFANVLNVDLKDYKKMRDEKQKGIREIGSSAIRAPEIDVKSANSADRDLAGLWSKNGGRL